MVAVITKRIVPSLTLGLLAGSILITKNIFSGTVKAAEYLVGSLASKESAFIVLFLFLFGSLTEIFKLPAE